MLFSYQSQYFMIYQNKLFPAKVNQIATCLPGHCNGCACS